MNLVKDREFLQLMKTGRPGTSLPTPMTVARDVKLSSEKCRERIDKILKVGLIFNIHYYTYIFFRIIRDVFTLQQMLGPPQTIVPLLCGQFICTMRVIFWLSFWMS